MYLYVFSLIILFSSLVAVQAAETAARGGLGATPLGSSIGAPNAMGGHWKWKELKYHGIERDID